MKTLCCVTDEESRVIVMSGELIKLLSKVHKSPQTHAIIKYYKDLDEALTGGKAIYKVFPLENIYFEKENR